MTALKKKPTFAMLADYRARDPHKVKLPDRAALDKYYALKRRARDVAHNAQKPPEDRVKTLMRSHNNVNLFLIKNYMDEFDRLAGAVESHTRLGYPTQGFKDRQAELKRLATVATQGQKHPLFL